MPDSLGNFKGISVPRDVFVRVTLTREEARAALHALTWDDIWPTQKQLDSAWNKIRDALDKADG